MKLGPVFELTQPPMSGWSWVNQQGATVVDSVDHIYLNAPGLNTAVQEFRLRTRAAPATPYVITAGMLFNMTPRFAAVGMLGFGLAFRESSTGKLVIFWFYANQGSAAASEVPWMIQIFGCPSPSALGPDYGATYAWTLPGLLFVRIADDGTNLKFYISTDGVNFGEVFSQGRTVYLVGGPNEVAFFAHNYNFPTAGATGVNLLSWKVT